MLIGETTQRNTFVCQPQQRNTAGRVFGGFLMRRAYELAFATAYQVRRSSCLPTRGLCWALQRRSACASAPLAAHPDALCHSVTPVGCRRWRLRTRSLLAPRLRFGGARPQCLVCADTLALPRPPPPPSPPPRLQFGGARPQFLAVADTSFRHPVDVGDLMRLTAFVVHTQRDGARPDTALVAVDVEARVLNPEGLSTRVTNTFTFTYAVQLGGRPLRRVVPGEAPVGNGTLPS
jgi:acyl-CoA hydrolase